MNCTIFNVIYLFVCFDFTLKEPTYVAYSETGCNHTNKVIETTNMPEGCYWLVITSNGKIVNNGYINPITFGDGDSTRILPEWFTTLMPKITQESINNYYMISNIIFRNYDIITVILFSSLTLFVLFIMMFVIMLANNELNKEQKYNIYIACMKAFLCVSIFVILIILSIRVYFDFGMLYDKMN